MNYFDRPLTTGRLKGLLKKLGIPAFGLLRTKEKRVNELGLTAESPESEILAAIAENPALLNRPIVEKGSRAVIARPIEKALALVSGTGAAT